MKWGRGELSTLIRVGTIAAEELRQAEVTCEILSGWYDFYRNEAETNSRNRAAAARALT